MFKKISKFSLLLVISVFTSLSSVNAKVTIDSLNRSDNMKPFTWVVISGVEKLVPTKDMSRSKIKKLEEGNALYSEGIDLMKNGKDIFDENPKDKEEYIDYFKKAIEKFKLARKSYKRAKITEHDYNYININQALCYASSGKESDFAVAKRYIGLVTSKIEKEKEWLYNLAIANNMIQDYNAAISNLTISIRLDENYFQAYKTLVKIHENLGNTSNAKKVKDRMETAEARLIKKEQKNKRKGKGDKDDNSEEKEFVFEGVRPDVTTLNIVKDDDNLQFNKVSQIKERSMTLVQEGVGSYNNGVNALARKNYDNAIEELKLAEKKLKRAKIKDHGLNFSRAQLAIAYLSLEDKKSKLGQVKRNLKNITKKLYDSRDWTYNIAVVNYVYGTEILKRYEKDKDKWIAKAKKSEFLKNAIKLFKLTIRHDKLYLAPYQNLAYIYKELGDENKAEKYQKQFNKRRNELIRSFDREEQIKRGVENEYVFRIHLGKYEEYEAPADMFDEPYLITVPINERFTAYLSGMYFTLNEAKEYLKEIITKEYTPRVLNPNGGDRNKGYPKIIPYKNGEEIGL